MSDKLLNITGLSAGYGPLRVLHEIDFSVAAGERLAIVGLNGHGKTTLFRAIMHLVGWQRGSVVFNGIEIGGTRSLGEGRRTPGIVRLGIAMTPQGDAIFPGLTVKQHLDCGAYTKASWRDRALRRDHIYDIFPQLKDLEQAYVGKLSGGERRMVSVGRALMADARLLSDRRAVARPCPENLAARGGCADRYRARRQGDGDCRTECRAVVRQGGPHDRNACRTSARRRRPVDLAVMDAGLVVYALYLAAIYGLMAIGISLLWSSVGMVNMAHGATFAIAGYAAYFAAIWAAPLAKALFGASGWDIPALAFFIGLVAIVAGALFGIVIYLIAFLPIHDKENFAVRSLIITLALNLATVQALLWAFGPQQKALPRVFGTGRFTTLGMSIRIDQVVTIVATTLLLGSVLAWLRRSRKGLEIRAVMQNAEGAALCGISTRKTALPIMMLTGALAGLAAVLLSQNVFVSPTAGVTPLIKGLTIALLGGLGSVPGAVFGAVLIGFIEAATGAIPFLGQRYVLFVQFTFIVCVLLIRPRGLGGLLDETRE